MTGCRSCALRTVALSGLLPKREVPLQRLLLQQLLLQRLLLLQQLLLQRLLLLLQGNVLECAAAESHISHATGAWQTVLRSRLWHCLTTCREGAAAAETHETPQQQYRREAACLFAVRHLCMRELAQQQPREGPAS